MGGQARAGEGGDSAAKGTMGLLSKKLSAFWRDISSPLYQEEAHSQDKQRDHTDTHMNTLMRT